MHYAADFRQYLNMSFLRDGQIVIAWSRISSKLNPLDWFGGVIYRMTQITPDNIDKCNNRIRNDVTIFLQELSARFSEK